MAEPDPEVLSEVTVRRGADVVACVRVEREAIGWERVAVVVGATLDSYEAYILAEAIKQAAAAVDGLSPRAERT